MTHSTTGTFTYILSKYSRSCPTRRTTQNTQTQFGPELSSDWQHFTNPVIRLVLDVKSAKNGEIQSVRLRILWQLDADQDVASNQADMEDLDLLSFAAISSSVPRKSQVEGLPLKAVYRDSVVGIRYLQSRADSATPVYRRFQISFQTHTEASDFIEVIKPVCPCKVNPTSAHPPSVQQGPARNFSPIGKHMAISSATRSIQPNQRSSYNFQQPSLPVSAQQNFTRPQNMHTPPHASLPRSLTTPSSPSGHQASSDLLPSDVLSDARVHPSLYSLQTSVQHATTSFSTISDVHINPVSAVAATPNKQPNVALNIPSSLPSLPSSDNSVQAPVQPPSMREILMDQKMEVERLGPIFSSFDGASVYNMSNSTLERLVGEIIHEDGFVQLLERLSGMLPIRTVLHTG